MGLGNFDDLLKKLLAGGLSALVIKVASAGLSYTMFVVLARLMPAAEYGRFAFGFSLAITASLLLSFGLPVAVLRFWPEYNVKGAADMARSFVARGFSVVAIGSALCTAAALVLAIVLIGDQSLYGVRYLGAIATLIVLMAVSEFVSSALRADGSIIAALAPRDVLWRVGVVALAVTTAAAVSDLDATTALQLASLSLAAILLPQLLHAIRRLKISRQNLAGRSDYGFWVRSAWPMWGSAILFGLVQQFDTVLMGLFVTPEETGPYFASLRTASLMTLLLIAGNMVAAPLISHYYHKGDANGLRRMCSLLIVGISVPTLAGFALLALLGPWLLGLFDASFVSAYPLLLVLSSGFTITALAGPVPYFLQMVGREREYLAITALVYAGVVVAQCIAIPIYGAMGAAVPNAVGAAIAAIWSVSLLRRQVGFDPSVIGLAWPVRHKGATA